MSQDTPVILEADRHLSQEQITAMKAEAEKQLGPGFKVLVLAVGIRGRAYPAAKAN